MELIIDKLVGIASIGYQIGVFLVAILDWSRIDLLKER
jgi:hypothetical protein